MQNIDDIYAQVQRGKTTFEPESASKSDRAAFQVTVRLLRELMSQGKLSYLKEHQSSTHGDDWIDLVVVAL
jgi:hypothetical protein